MLLAFLNFFLANNQNFNIFLENFCLIGTLFGKSEINQRWSLNFVKKISLSLGN